jgi:hypothetical protein
VREADRPRAVGSSRRGEHIHDDWPVDSREVPAARLGECRRSPTGKHHGLNERNKLVASRCAEKPDSRIYPSLDRVVAVYGRDFATSSTLSTLGTLRTLGTFGTPRILTTFSTFSTLRTLSTLSALRLRIFNRDGWSAVDAVLSSSVAFENQIHFLDRDLVGQRWKLVENLPRFGACFALERLREKEKPNGPRHRHKQFAQLLLV